jgi:hypothetical protein
MPHHLPRLPRKGQLLFEHIHGAHPVCLLHRVIAPGIDIGVIEALGAVRQPRHILKMLEAVIDRLLHGFAGNDRLLVAHLVIGIGTQDVPGQVARTCPAGAFDDHR